MMGGKAGIWHRRGWLGSCGGGSLWVFSVVCFYFLSEIGSSLVKSKDWGGSVGGLRKEKMV